MATVLLLHTDNNENENLTSHIYISQYLFVCFNCVAYFVCLLKSFLQALTDIHIYHFYGFLFVCLSMVNLFLFIFNQDFNRLLLQDIKMNSF